MCVSTLLKVAVIYAGIAFAGGSMLQSSHPGFVRTGQTLHAMLMINPMIRWADAHEQHHLVDVLVTVARGMPRDRLS
jgi:hypothetical protein